MTLSVRGDPSRPGGGYAILSSTDGPLPEQLAVKDLLEDGFLNENGRRTPRMALFRVEPFAPGAVRLGPEIVNNIPPDSLVSFHAPGGADLGKLEWPANIRVSAAPRGVNVIGGAPPPPSPPPPPPRPESERTVFQPAPFVAREPDKPTPPYAPPEVAPAPRRWKWWLIAAGAVLLAAFAFGRDSAFEQRLVCPNGATFGGLIAPCHRLTSDPEEDAYNEYLHCAVNQSSCKTADCARVFLSRFPSGRHAGEVETGQRGSLATCGRDREGKIYAEFEDCIAGKPACDQLDCVGAVRPRLSTPEYLKRLDAAQSEAARQCQTERAFAQFQSCLQRTPACDADACQRQYGGALSGGPHAGEAQGLLARRLAACTPPQPPAPTPTPTPEDDARAFIDKYYRELAALGDGSNAFDDIYAPNVRIKVQRGGGAALTPGRRFADQKKGWFRDHSISKATYDYAIESLACSTMSDCEATVTVTFSYTDADQNPKSNHYRVRLGMSGIPSQPRIVDEEVQ